MTARTATAADRAMLDLAARCAIRAAGDVEPNPLVGAVVGRRLEAGVQVLGVGHHRRFGGSHAEVEAIDACRARARDARGATLWVTLEPCAHQGKTPPCADRIIESGVGEVVVARADPSAAASGGAAKLEAAGIAVRWSRASAAAARLADPFVHRARAGRPFVIAKWAQTIDGRIATRAGASQWISNEQSRRDVHRLRARMDAVVTGVGTVFADDPMLTARGVRRLRRIARRVVIDPGLRIPASARIVRTAAEVPTIVVCHESRAGAPAAAPLRDAGVQVLAAPGPAPDRLHLDAALRLLAERHDATNVLVEAGPRLVGSLHREGLLDELRVFIAPALMADPAALPVASGAPVDDIAALPKLDLVSLRRRGGDIAAVYRRPLEPV